VAFLYVVGGEGATVDCAGVDIVGRRPYSSKKVVFLCQSIESSQISKFMG